MRKKSTACQYTSINLLGNKNNILITRVPKSVKHLETSKRNVYNLSEEKTNYIEGFSYSSHLEKIHHIPGWENPLLRQCQLYPNLFTHLMQFHSTT